MNVKGEHCGKETDVTIENLPNFTKCRSTNGHVVAPPYMSRYGECEELLTFFPKSKRDIEALRAFGVKACNFDSVLDEKLQLFKVSEETNSFEVEREKLRLKLRQHRENINKQWIEVNEKEEELKKKTKIFGEFIAMNKEKRDRLRANMEETKIVRERRERGIELFKERNPEIKAILEDLRKEIEKLSKYENFLHRVLKKDPESRFQYTTDLIHHYEILCEGNKMLSEKFDKTLQVVCATLRKMVNLTKSGAQNVSALKTEIWNLRQQYSVALMKAKENQKFFTYTLEKIRQKYQESLASKDAIYSIYTMMGKTRTLKHWAEKADFKTQLTYMSKVIRQMDSM